MEPNWLNPREDRAWRAFVYANYQLVAHLNRGLQESGLSGADYAVLAVLSDHDGDRMPARDLCSALSWEKSRVSHQVRRMQKDGLDQPRAQPRRRPQHDGLPAAGWPRRHREGGAQARG